MIGILGLVEITRSAVHKVSRQNSFGNWISDETFMSIKAQCPVAEAEQTAAVLYAFCRENVDRDFAQIKARLQAQGETESASPQTEPYEQPHRAPEENPFKVTVAPKPVVETPVETNAPVAETAITPVNGVYPEGGKAVVSKPEVVQSGAPEPPKEEKRGRRPKPPEGPAAMEALKATAPPETLPAKANTGAGNGGPQTQGGAPSAESPQSGFQASADDLPDNIAAAPHQNVKSQVERLKAIEQSLAREHKRTDEQAGSALRTFVKAFLHVDKLPKPPTDVYEKHLPLFEAFARLYGGQMLTAAQVEGEKAGASWGTFVRKIDAWPEIFKMLARQMAVAHYPDEVMNLLEFLENDGITVPGPSMLAFLKLLRISRNSVLAARDAAVKRNVTLDQVVWALDLDTATEAMVLSAVAGGPVQTGQPELWSE